MQEASIYTPQVPRQSRQLPIRGINYVVNSWGNAEDPLLIYLHGWGDTGSTFQFVVDELSRRWFVVAPDWRGFGRTRVATGATATAYWFADYLADLDQLLAQYSPSQPVRLIGHSMGGNIGGLYAGAMPERVRAFVNIEGFGLPDSDPVTAPDRYRAWIEQCGGQPSFAPIADIAALANRIHRSSPRMTKAQAGFVAEEWAVAAADGSIRLRADPMHKLPNAVLYRRAEAEACWRQVEAEVLLLGGSDSRFLRAQGVNPDASIPQLPFPRLTTQVIEGSGHMVHFERPSALASAIDSFFEKTL